MRVGQIWRYGETVRAIYLNDNAIAELPDRICALPSLTALHLERNKLTHLPYGLHRLTTLTALALHDNLLYDPPQVCLGPRPGMVAASSAK